MNELKNNFMVQRLKCGYLQGTMWQVYEEQNGKCTFCKEFGTKIWKHNFPAVKSW